MAASRTTQHPPRTSRRYTLSEKIAIVRESQWPGARVADVARKHGLARNVLYYWRKVYRDMAQADLTQAKPEDGAANEISDLRLQLRNLQRRHRDDRVMTFDEARSSSARAHRLRRRAEDLAKLVEDTERQIRDLHQELLHGPQPSKQFGQEALPVQDTCRTRNREPRKAVITLTQG